MLLRLRKSFQSFQNKCASAFLRAGFTPNSVTVLSVILSLIAAVLYAISPQFAFLLWFAGGVLFASGFLDAVDGALARMSSRASNLGSYLDSLLDRYSDSIVILGIAVGFSSVSILGLNIVIWGIIATFGSIITSYTRAKAESLGVTMAGIGIAERPERIAILLVSTAFLRPDIGLVIIAFASNLTVAQRSIHVVKKLHSRDH
ncbi:MAG: CDP-alcohol phosphatidyltransferase family protein [Candidatus Bathyarchaeia archaeon]